LQVKQAAAQASHFPETAFPNISAGHDGTHALFNKNNPALHDKH